MSDKHYLGDRCDEIGGVEGPQLKDLAQGREQLGFSGYLMVIPPHHQNVEQPTDGREVERARMEFADHVGRADCAADHTCKVFMGLIAAERAAEQQECAAQLSDVMRRTEADTLVRIADAVREAVKGLHVQGCTCHKTPNENPIVPAPARARRIRMTTRAVSPPERQQRRRWRLNEGRLRRRSLSRGGCLGGGAQHPAR